MMYNSEWVKYYDKIYSSKEYDREVSFILSYLKEPKTKTVLDVGCGTGNHSILIAPQVSKIVGIDPSEDMIEIAQKKRRTRNCFFKNCYLDWLHKEEKFDLVISMFNVINQIEHFDDVYRFLKDVACRTKKDGYFIFDCWNQIATIIVNPKEKVVTSGNIISKCTSTIDNMNSKIVLHNSISDSLEKKLYYYDIEINLWQPKALRDSLEGLGFDVAVFKAFDNRKDASENDYKIVFVGRKNK